MNVPAELFLDGKLVAKVTIVAFETPWATGEVQFNNKELFSKLVDVTSISSLDLELEEQDLDEKEEERLWNLNLSKLGLTDGDLNLDQDDRWCIQIENESLEKIYAVKFYHNGFMDWRP